MMAWERVHRRNRVVRAVVDRAADGPASPTPAEREAIAREFVDLADFLLAVHALWTRAFEARLDAVLETGQLGPQPAAAEAWSDLADALPGARRILDAYADQPELARATALADQRLLTATGIDARALAPAGAGRHAPLGCDAASVLPHRVVDVSGLHRAG